MRRALLWAAALASPTAAQSFRVLPAGFSYDTVPGNFAYEAPLGQFYGRVLQVFDDSVLPFQSATVTQIALRRDTFGRTHYTTRDRLVQLRMGHTTYGTRNMPNSFAAIAAGATQVFAATINIPAEPAPAPGQPAPWSVVVPFTQPWNYARGSGRMFFDLAGETRTLSSGTWAVDGFRALTDDRRGSRTSSGLPCATSQGYEIYSGGEPPVPGEILGVGMQGSLPASVTTSVLWLGTLRAQPLRLDNFGARGCNLYVDPVIAQGAPVTRFGGESRTSYATWATPPDASLNGLTVSTQAAVPLPTANPLGMLFSDATTLTFGTRGSRVFPAQMLWQSNEQGDLGTVGPEEAGIIVELGGTFR